MNTPFQKGDRTEEKRIALLVKMVRVSGCEDSFKVLYEYLSSYISLFGHKYKIPGCDKDEIEQECLYALRYKAIEDFNASRGKFRSFAILCMKRHLFSMIKGSNQQKRKVLNESLSLNEDRSEGDDLSLSNIVMKQEISVEERMEKAEITNITKSRLMERLSKLEREVFVLYLQQLTYEEIVDELKKKFPDKRWSKKSADNALVRCRAKAQELGEDIDFLT